MKKEILNKDCRFYQRLYTTSKTKIKVKSDLKNWPVGGKIFALVDKQIIEEHLVDLPGLRKQRDIFLCDEIFDSPWRAKVRFVNRRCIFQHPIEESIGVLTIQSIDNDFIDVFAIGNGG